MYCISIHSHIQSHIHIIFCSIFYPSVYAYQFFFGGPNAKLNLPSVNKSHRFDISPGWNPNQAGKSCAFPLQMHGEPSLHNPGSAQEYSDSSMKEHTRLQGICWASNEHGRGWIVDREPQVGAQLPNTSLPCPLRMVTLFRFVHVVHGRKDNQPDR